MGKLKIGFLVDRVPTDRHLLDLHEWVEVQDDLEVTAVVVCEPEAYHRQDGAYFKRSIGARVSGLAFRVLTNIEQGIIGIENIRRSNGVSSNANPRPPHCVRILLGKALTLDHAYRLSESDVQKIRELDLDLLVQFGAREFKGNVLGAARLGSIALDYHGNRANKSVEPGFWEAYHKLPKTRFAIVHLTLENPNGMMIVSGAFPTKFLFLLNRSHLYGKSFAQLRAVLRKIAVARVVSDYESSMPYSGKSYIPPSFFQTIKYLAKLLFRVAKKIAFKILNVKQKWGLSVIHSNWRSAALWRSTRINAPRGHFWADPFLYARDGKTYCYVEDFVYASGRGHITVLELTEGGAVELGTCIREDYHLSFPYIFRFEGDLYMCPESSEARQIRIYRCVGFPMQWELFCIPMDDISAADTMFFEHGGKWWMMTNIDHSGLEDHCSELYLFWADSPFAKSWNPHPQNPIRIDPEGGRNAGMIIEGGKLYRGAQCQGFDQYGQGLILYEIVEMSETAYSERLVSEITCDFREGLLGSHHVSTTGKITAFDHVSRTFFP